ncbi:MAG TPA: pitrilysin family protein [Thermoanaerobaculia bacterium]|nr:pitrilysin family protein [Thermoanaerobaculia bacterium]
MKSRLPFLAVVLFTAFAAVAAPPPAAKPAAKSAKPAAAGRKVAPPARLVPVTSVEGITEYRLPNGLQVLLFPDPTKPTATVNVTYRVGSRNEEYGETGMAHLLEHLMFKGTPEHKNIYGEMTSHGARNNASTWFDRTNYFETFDASDANVKWALELEADRMIHSFISQKDLASEMTVVRNEFESGENEPARILEERVLSTAYLWHNYGHSTIGARSDIENVPIPHLQAFYRMYYQPDNATLLVAGRFDPEKTLAWIQEDFGKIPKPARVLPTFYTQEPTQDGERDVDLRRVGDVQELAVAYHVPAGSHPDAAPIDLLVQILADTPAGRLHKSMVETHQASSIGGYLQPLHDPGFVIFDAEVPPEKPLDVARKTMLATLDGLASAPFTAEELERARTQLLKDIDLTLNVTSRVGIELSEWIGMGDWRLFFLHRDQVRKATLADVQRVAAEYLKPSNRTVGAFYPTPKPDRAEIPATPDVEAELAGYKGDQAIAAGEAFDPAPANIEKRLTRKKLGNGAEVALLPKKTRGETVFLSGVLRFGTVESLKGLDTAASFAGSMLLRGSKKHTRQEIQDAFDKLKARVSIGGGATQATIGIETTRANLPALLKLVVEVLREPAFPEKEFELLREESLADIEQQMSDPQAIAFNNFERHLSDFPKGDVRYVETPQEEKADVQAIKLDDAKKFYDRFYGASHAQIAIVGDFDPAAVMPVLEEGLGSWTSTEPFERVPHPFQDIAPEDKSFETPDKANAFFVAGENLRVRDDDPDYPALLLGNYIFGGGFLNSRLATRIRQKEGLSYGVGSSLTASALDESGSFLEYAIYAPQNAAKLRAAVEEEMQRLMKDGFTAEEVKDARSGYLQARQVSRAQDPELARRLSGYLFLHRTMEYDAKLDAKIAALTPAEILAALKRHLDPSKITYVRAGDFANASKYEKKPGGPSPPPPSK